MQPLSDEANGEDAAKKIAIADMILDVIGQNDEENGEGGPARGRTLAARRVLHRDCRAASSVVAGEFER